MMNKNYSVASEVSATDNSRKGRRGYLNNNTRVVEKFALFNATTVTNQCFKRMRDSLTIAQEIGREMKLEAADALLSVSSEPREGKLEENDGEDKVVRSSCCNEPTKKIVKIEPVNGGTVKSKVIKEPNFCTPTYPDSTVSPNHRKPRSEVPLKSTERNSRTPTNGFFQHPDQMHSMDQHSFPHPGIAIHQYPNNFPYGASYPFPYTPHPWHSEVRFHPLDQQRSRNRSTPKMEPLEPRVWR